MNVQANQLSEAMKLALLPEAERLEVLSSLTRDEARLLNYDWGFWGRPAQMEPPGSWWTTWLVMAGRGFGKTRLGSEWIRSMVCGKTPLARGRVGRIALVAETAADGRDVMVQGPSGILAVHPPEFRPRYVKSDRTLYWPNGAIALMFSAEDPEQLRGPEHEAAWCDETAKWRYAQDTWDMLQFGLRIGEQPRQLVTTTPRPIPILRKLLAEEGKPGGTTVTRGRTFDNSANLAASFVGQMKRRYEGTRLGRQELDAELLEDVQGALWNRSMLERRNPANPKAAGMSIDDAGKVPPLRRIAVGVDPSGSSGDEEKESDDIGIVCVGLGDDDVFYVLEDASSPGSPLEWGRAVVGVYKRRDADIIVGEVNYGGAMVEYTIRTIDRRVNYKAVNASRGKIVRAEPVAALYEQGKVRHVGEWPELEDQMCGMTREGYEGRGSPDRVDALVWAITELAFGSKTYSTVDMKRAHG